MAKASKSTDYTRHWGMSYVEFRLWHTKTPTTFLHTHTSHNTLVHKFMLIMQMLFVFSTARNRYDHRISCKCLAVSHTVQRIHSCVDIVQQQYTMFVCKSIKHLLPDLMHRQWPIMYFRTGNKSQWRTMLNKLNSSKQVNTRFALIQCEWMNGLSPINFDALSSIWSSYSILMCHVWKQLHAAGTTHTQTTSTSFITLTIDTTGHW